MHVLSLYASLISGDDNAISKFKIDVVVASQTSPTSGDEQSCLKKSTVATNIRRRSDKSSASMSRGVPQVCLKLE